MSGALYLYEVGSDDVGLARAGFAYRAQDASTLFTNPVDMTRIRFYCSLAKGRPDFSLKMKKKCDMSGHATERKKV
jgi:hypothetical protein